MILSKCPEFLQSQDSSFYHFENLTLNQFHGQHTETRQNNSSMDVLEMIQLSGQTKKNN